MDEEEQELCVWIEETRQYVLKHVNAAIDVALQEIERIDFLWGRIRLSRLATTPIMKADVRVEGHLVVYTNLELKFSKSNRNAPVTAALQQYCVLNQILELHSILQDQLCQLQLLRTFLSREREDMMKPLDPEQTWKSLVGYFVKVVRKCFQDLTTICQELRTAANVLRLPSRRRFPYSAYVDHSFKPSLPPEIVVDFSIHRGELLIEAFVLALTQKSHISDIPDGCCTKKELVGCVCLCRGQKVEIMDYVSASLPIPQVEEMVTHLQEQTAWLVHIRDNVKALLDCQV